MFLESLHFIFSPKKYASLNLTFFLKCHEVILRRNQFYFHLPLVPEGLVIVSALTADWTMRRFFLFFLLCELVNLCYCPLLAAAVSCSRGLTAPPLSPQRGLPQGEHCEECGQQEVCLQLAAAQGLPPALPAARRHLRQGGNLTDPRQGEDWWGAGDQ